MAHRGVSAGLKLDSDADVLTNVSSWVRTIGGTTDPSRLDATTLQPDEPNPSKAEIGGYTSRAMSVTFLYTEEAFTFMKAIEGDNGLNYELGPRGFTAGRQRIKGLLNVLSVSLPTIGTDSIEEFTAEMSRTTEEIDTF